MRAALQQKLKGSAMLWCVILMSILALVVMLSISVAAAYDKSVVKSVCLNQLEYDADAALKIACSSICTDEIYYDGNEPDFPIFSQSETDIFFGGNTSMSFVSLQWNKEESKITAVASVPDYGERSVSAVIKKNEQIIINSVSFPIVDEENENITYIPSPAFVPDYYYYQLCGNTEIDTLNYNGVYFFKGTENDKGTLSFETVGNNYVSADIYINLAHSQELEICNVPPNVNIFVFPSPEDINNEAVVTVSGTDTVKGFIHCKTLITDAKIETDKNKMPDKSIVDYTMGYSYEFVKFTD